MKDDSGLAHRDREGRWLIWSVATGERLARWPVDAKGMVTSGEFSFEAPVGAVIPVPDLVTGSVPRPAA